MGTPYTFDEGMSCHSTRIELFYFDDNFRRIAQWVRPLTCDMKSKMIVTWDMDIS